MRARTAARRLAVAAAVGTGTVAAAVYGASELRLRRTHPLPAGALSVPVEAADPERGRHLVRHVAQCAGCHGDDLGGAPIVDDLWMGRLHAPNLTPGPGGIAHRSDADLVRAIRFGLAPDGESLLMMPAQHLAALSDADLAAILASLRALPAVARRAPEPRVGPFARLVLALDLAPELLPAAEAAERHAAAASERGAAPRPAATAAYGAYVAEAAGCRLCHGADLRGGLHPLALPGEPVPPDLTPAGRVRAWSQNDFLRALRTGRTPEGDVLDATYMPWRSFRGMDDLELRALWRFLRALPDARRSSDASSAATRRSG